MFKINKLNILLAFLIFLVSLIPRAYKLQETEIYPDEITWMVRAKESFLAIKTGRLDYFKTAWWRSENDTEAINLPAAIISGASMFFLAKNQPTHYSLNILPDYIAVRLPLVVINSLFVVFLFFVFKKLSKNTTLAILGSLMFSFDPISIALSRWFLADSYLAIWLFLSFYCFYFIKKKSVSIITSSFFLSLAFLTKPTAIIILPVFLLISPFKFILTLVTFSLFVHVFWLGTNGYVGLEIFEYVSRQFKLSQEPFKTFFAGKVTTNPPIYYYLYQLTTRLPSLTLFGLSIYIFAKNIRKKIISRKLSLYVLIFIFMYLLVFSLSSKKLGIRYIYPIYPWIYYFSSFSLVSIFEKFKPKFKYLFYLLSFIYLGILSYFYFPNYYLFYNQISGGPSKMQKYNMVSLCMGAKDSILFIQKNFETDSIAYIGCNRFAVNYYSGVKVTSDWKNEKYVIVEESLKTLTPDDEVIKYFSDKKPEFINRQQGVILSRVYSN